VSQAPADGEHEVAAQLGQLAKELETRGFDVQGLEADGRTCVSVSNRTVTELHECVYVAEAHAGEWWFWWSWGDQLAPVADIETAAFKIAYVLTPALSS
jgi:hypothetical protein